MRRLARCGKCGWTTPTVADHEFRLDALRCPCGGALQLVIEPDAPPPPLPWEEPPAHA